MLSLQVEKREQKKSVKDGDKIPAVFYGPKEASVPVFVSKKDFLDVWKTAGESSVIELAGIGDSKEALIHDIDFDPVSGNIRHADFYIIEKGKKLEVSVPLVFVGEAPAVKELGGTLVKVLHELLIEAMPKDLPHEISVDVSGIVDFETQIHVSDLDLPSGVISRIDGKEVVALVSEVKEEEIFEEVSDIDSIEVEKKGKDEVSGEESNEENAS